MAAPRPRLTTAAPRFAIVPTPIRRHVESSWFRNRKDSKIFLFYSRIEKIALNPIISVALPDLALVSEGRAQRVAHHASKILLRKFCRVRTKERRGGHPRRWKGSRKEEERF